MTPVKTNAATPGYSLIDGYPVIMDEHDLSYGQLGMLQAFEALTYLPPTP